MNRIIRSLCLLNALLFLLASTAHAEDWPQWRGDREGNWTEKGILEKFPESGLKVVWRAPIGPGYSGPVVSEGKVIVLDWLPKPDSLRIDGTERVFCLDELTGKTLWSQEWPVDYSSMMQSYATGPRATPSIEGGHVYLMGAMGNIYCLKLATGEVVWTRDALKDYTASVPTWGLSGSPLVDGNVVIFMIGGEGNAGVIALDKMTGKEVWKAIEMNGEPGYSQPIIFEAGGKRQLIIWDLRALTSLDPATGNILWTIPYRTPNGMSIATPTKSGNLLFVSSFYGGSLMTELAVEGASATTVWQIKGKSEMPGKTESLHSVITTPIIIGDHIYSTCSYGELRCIEARTGTRVWEDRTMARQGRWGSAFMVQNGDRWFVNNDVGDLIIAQFTPEKYIEISRTKLIEPTTSSGFGPRKLFDSIVNWVHPAYANQHIITRNDKEVIRASLAAE